MSSSEHRSIRILPFLLNVVTTGARSIPISLLQTLIFVRSPDWLNAGLIFLGYACDYALLRSSQHINMLWNVRNIASFLRHSEKTTFKVVDYCVQIPQERLAEVHRGRFDVPPQDVAKLPSVDVLMKAFVVIRGESELYPAEVCSLPDIDGRCIVFLNVEPQPGSVYRKFELCHEIGHASSHCAKIESRLSGKVAWLGFAVWASVAGVSTQQNAVTIAALLALQFACFFKWDGGPYQLFSRDKRLQSELAADQFALSCMTRSEREVFRRHAEQIPDDALLDPWQCALRKLALTTTLRRTIEAETFIPDYGDVGSLGSDLLPVAILPSLAFLSQVHSPAREWMLVAIAAVSLIGLGILRRMVRGAWGLIRQFIVERLVKSEEPSDVESIPVPAG